MSGEVGERGRFVYFDTEYHPGTVIELSEVAGPKGEMFGLIREASEGWDGQRPGAALPRPVASSDADARATASARPT